MTYVPSNRKKYPPEEKRHLYYAFVQIGKIAHKSKVQLRDHGDLDLPAKVRHIEKHMKVVRSFLNDAKS